MKYLLSLLAIPAVIFALNYHGCTLAQDNQHGWVVCLDTALIFKTTNGGVTWTQQQVPAGSKKFFDVTCSDSLRAWTCGILGEILHTENGGSNWYRQILGLSKYATRVEFIDENYGYAACGWGKVGTTTNGGGRFVNELHVGFQTKVGNTWNTPVESKVYERHINVSRCDTIPLDTIVNTADSLRIYFYFDDLGTRGFYAGIDNISVFAVTTRDGPPFENQSWDFESGWQGWTHTNGQPFPAGWDVQPANIHTPPPNPGDSSLWIDSYAAGFGVVVQDTAWSPPFAPAPGDTQKIALAQYLYSEGTFWEQNSLGYPWDDAELYGIHFVDELTGWTVAGWPDANLTGQGIIFRSTDGGITWDSLYQVSGYEDFFDVHFFNLLNGIVVGGDDSTYAPIILKTTDGGNTWNTVDVPPNSYYLRAVDFVDNDGWAVGKSGTVIHMSDGGNTWTTQSSPADSTLFDVDFSDHQHGLACGYNLILRTTDGGQNWHSVSIEEYDLQNPAIVTLIASPNPFRHKVNIRYILHDAGCTTTDIALKIYDVSGRLVKDFRPTFHAIFPTHLSWDGTDDRGKHLPAGVYFLELRTAENSVNKKLVLLK